MSRRNKLVDKIFSKKVDIRPSEAQKILIMLGYIGDGPNSGSSHLTYRKIDRPSITIVLT